METPPDSPTCITMSEEEALRCKIDNQSSGSATSEKGGDLFQDVDLADKDPETKQKVTGEKTTEEIESGSDEISSGDSDEREGNKYHLRSKSPILTG